MHVAFILCDAAQVSDGKTHMLGAGWRMCGPVVGAYAVVAIITFDALDAGTEHQVALELVDEDGHPVVLPTPNGPMTIRSEGSLLVQASPDAPVGLEIDAPWVANIGPGMPLAPGGRYVWQLWIDGDTQDDWRHAFYVRPMPNDPPLVQ